MSASRARRQPQPIQYCDHHDRVWFVSELAGLKFVSPAIDGPNVALVIRFEREGEERFGRWIAGEDWHASEALNRRFAESDRVGPCTAVQPPRPNDEDSLGT